MPTSNPTEILIKHHRWANDSLIRACRALSQEQLDREFEMGVGSILKTVIHIVGAMQGWGDLLAGREQRPRLETGAFDLEQIAVVHERVADDLESSALTHPVDEIVTGERGGRSFSFTRGGVITHVTTHGMHHRAQCLNMLRHVGVDPLPASSVADWMRMADSEKLG